jgi:hypothetical protein
MDTLTVASRFQPFTPAGEIPPVPETKDELLIAALRAVNAMSEVMNAVSSELGRVLDDDQDNPIYNDLYATLRRRFQDASGVHLFIAADNLGLELPPDLADDGAELEPEPQDTQETI